MNGVDIKAQMAMTYAEQTAHLLKKYGAAAHDYFYAENCKRKNPNVSREKEGLDCHHIDEDKAILLDRPLYAAKNPFAYQKAERLVYAAPLEHYLLHVKLVEEPTPPNANKNEIFGIGELVDEIAPKLNDFYSSHPQERENYALYLQMVRRLWKTLEKEKLFSKEMLCVGQNGAVYPDLFSLLQ